MPKKNVYKDLKKLFEAIEDNIDSLEQFVDNWHDYDDDGCVNVRQLKVETEELLQRLKDVPSEKIASVLKKRQNRRTKNKRRNKKKKQRAQKSEDQQPDVKAFELNQADIDRETKPSAQLYNHNQLKRFYAKQFVQKIELLEKTHLARGWDIEATQEFVSRLSNLRSVWMNELNSATTEPAHKSYEAQWNMVLFGVPTLNHLPVKQKLKDFLRIRRIWDSYISTSESATPIPRGWILPPEEAMPSWRQYQIE